MSHLRQLHRMCDHPTRKLTRLRQWLSGYKSGGLRGSILSFGTALRFTLVGVGFQLLKRAPLIRVSFSMEHLGASRKFPYEAYREMLAESKTQ